MSGLSIPGRYAKLLVSEDGVNYVNHGGLMDITLNENTDENECSSKDSAGNREYLVGFSDYSLDGGARFLDGDPGQQVVKNSRAAKTKFYVKFYMDVDPGSSKEVIEATAFATSFNRSAPLDDTSGVDFTYRLSNVVFGNQ